MKKYVRWPFLLVLVFVVGCAAFLLQAPSIQSILNEPIAGSQEGVCPGGGKVLVIYPEKSEAKIYLSKDHFVMVEFNADDSVKDVVFGEFKFVDGKFVVGATQVLSLEQARAMFPNPCDFLYPKTV